MTAKTIYPSNGDYNLSVANLNKFAREPRLVQARPQQVATGLAAYSGGYSRVYPVQSGSGKYALRCWTADVGEARERYRRIGAYLVGQRLPYFVEFEYLEDAIVVKGQHYPVLWMEWAEGPRLREYVAQHLGNKPVLRALAQAFREMVATLHAANISHGDLQDENIIVQDTPAGPRLRLIDYDSLFVPALQGFSDQIIGVSHYQHPRRNTLRKASERVDYFSELVIYLSLLVYEQNPALWNHGAEKQLLFADTDFVDPNRSKAFQDISFMTGEVAVLTKRLVQYCRETDLMRLEPLEVVTAGMGGGSASASSRPGRGLPSDFLTATAPAPTSAPGGPVLNVPDDFLSAPPPPSRPGTSTLVPARGVPDDLLAAPAPGPGPAATRAVNVPDDLVSAPPPPPRPAPAGLPVDLLNTPAGPPPATAQASSVSLPGSGSWDAFFDGARRTSRSQPNGGVLAVPRPAVTRAQTGVALPPVQRPVATAAPAGVAPAPPAAPPAAQKPVDWPALWRGFAFGLLMFLLIFILVLVVIHLLGGADLPTRVGVRTPPATAPAVLLSTALPTLGRPPREPRP